MLIEETGAVDFEEDDDFQFVRKSKRAKTEEAEPVKKTGGRGRPPKTKTPAATAEDEEFAAATKKNTTRRKAAPETHQDEPQPKVSKKGATRRGARQAGEDERTDAPTSTNGAAGSRKGKTARSANAIFESPAAEEPSQGSKVALPMSDTPIINRNKEMRKKGTGNRRSSLGSRGRRASSLIDSGQTALPHREVKPAEFYKHIEAEGLPEPRRMKQLLTWCGERALSEKPAHGTKNSSIIHGGT